MKIVTIAAGAAGMYCGSCLHDNSLAAALRARGEDILLVPTYTPTRTDEPNESIDRVFFGGINVFLQQQLALFRRTPWFLDRLLDHPGLISWLSARGAASTRAEQLGPLTVSMLRGEEGRQRKEVEKLVYWLEQEVRPEVVHLSNCMLLGMARSIHQRLKIPVVCGLSGEDIFLEKLIEPHYSTARALLRERARDVAAFVALNRYYAEFMQEYLDIPPSATRVIRHGLPSPLALPATRQATGDMPQIGYFARICPEKGLHVLVEAWALLARDASLPPIRLRAAGYLGAQDKPYLATIEQRVASLGLLPRFDFLGEVDRAGKIAFLRSLDVMSVPTTYRESKGISVLEAMAEGVPVVLPRHGAFPEIVADTGGGLLHEPHDPADLAARLRELILDRPRAERMGAQAKTAVAERYTPARMAEEHLALYRELLGARLNAKTRPVGSANTVKVSP